MPHVSDGHVERLGDLCWCRLAADLAVQLPAHSYDLVECCRDLRRNGDGAGVVADRTADRLADPPGGVGPELIAALILELVYRFDQADVAFLDEIEELQAAIGVFLRNRDDQAQVGLDHFRFGLVGLTLALLHPASNSADLADVETSLAGDSMDLRSISRDALGIPADQTVPAATGSF